MSCRGKERSNGCCSARPVSDAARLLRTNVAQEKALLLAPPNPNAVTIEAITEARGRNLKRFGSVQELLDDLDRAIERTKRSKGNDKRKSWGIIEHILTAAWFQSLMRWPNMHRSSTAIESMR